MRISSMCYTRIDYGSQTSRYTYICISHSSSHEITNKIKQKMFFLGIILYDYVSCIILFGQLPCSRFPLVIRTFWYFGCLKCRRKLANSSGNSWKSCCIRGKNNSFYSLLRTVHQVSFNFTRFSRIPYFAYWNFCYS